MLISWNPRVQHSVSHKIPPLNLVLSRCVKSTMFRLVSLTFALTDFYSSSWISEVLSCPANVRVKFIKTLLFFNGPRAPVNIINVMSINYESRYCARLSSPLVLQNSKCVKIQLSEYVPLYK